MEVVMMDTEYALAQKVVDTFGAVYRNLIRNENDSIVQNQNSQSAMLSVLLRNGPTKMSDISRVLRVTKSNITFLVDKLEEQDLIGRQPDPDDRRVMKIYLTDEGRSLIEAERKALLQKINGKLDTLGEDDLARLKDALDACLTILRKVYNAEEEEKS
jgi:DNA-binding MarR family transcriptional regulator